MPTPAVSIIIPLYNHQKYIGEALESVILQTFQDFECIVMDDGSTDRSLEIARTYEKRDSRIRVLTQRNTGLVGALNALSEQARGEFITTLDADDAFHPERLAVGVKKLMSAPRMAVSFCSTQVVDGDGNPSSMRAELLRGPLEAKDFLKTLVVRNFVASCAGLIRAKSLQSTKPFARDFAQVPDWDLWLRLSKSGDLDLSEEILVRVRWDGNNMSSKSLHLSYRQHYLVSKEMSDAIIARDRLGIETQLAVYGLRANWAFSTEDYVSAARELLLKRKITPLGAAESFTLITCLLNMGKASLSIQMLSAMVRDPRFQDPEMQKQIQDSLCKIKTKVLNSRTSSQRRFLSHNGSAQLEDIKEIER